MLELTDIIKDFSMFCMSPESSSKTFSSRSSSSKVCVLGFLGSRVARVMCVARNLDRFMWLARPTVAHTSVTG